MIFREAVAADIPQIQVVRNSVTENMLSDPDLVTDKHCEEFLFMRGKGWVCEIENQIIGFAIVDLRENNVWALFLKPDFEGKGIGTNLQNRMLDWYFNQCNNTIWLGTSPGTRAEKFYTKSGWVRNGMHGSNEVKFEMTRSHWQRIRQFHHL